MMITFWNPLSETNFCFSPAGGHLLIDWHEGEWLSVEKILQSVGKRKPVLFKISLGVRGDCSISSSQMFYIKSEYSEFYQKNLNISESLLNTSGRIGAQTWSQHTVLNLRKTKN